MSWDATWIKNKRAPRKDLGSHTGKPVPKPAHPGSWSCVISVGRVWWLGIQQFISVTCHSISLSPCPGTCKNKCRSCSLDASRGLPVPWAFSSLFRTPIFMPLEVCCPPHNLCSLTSGLMLTPSCPCSGGVCFSHCQTNKSILLLIPVFKK